LAVLGIAADHGDPAAEELSRWADRNDVTLPEPFVQWTRLSSEDLRGQSWRSGVGRQDPVVPGREAVPSGDR
jgi:hypothetical protein